MLISEKNEHGNINRNEKTELFDVTVEVLSEILGEKATEKIVNYLEKHFDIERDQIPNRIEEFYTGLQSLLGEKAVSLIQQAIVTKMRKKRNTDAGVSASSRSNTK